MEVGLHMNVGEGETSYAKNSQSQRSVLLKTKPIVEEAIRLFSSTSMPKTMNIADLGCSSGPNSFLPASMIMDAIQDNCAKLGYAIPDFHVFLNDLPDNDFNTVFKLISNFKQTLITEKGEKFGSCFVAGYPGSFYERLFPDDSMHFIYSANSLHWLSEVPLGLKGDMAVINKGNIALGRTSPSGVYQVYLKQFQKDFPNFIKLRSQEIVHKGSMVFSMLARKTLDPFDKESYNVLDALSQALADMVAEGIVAEAKLDSFNMPYYEPHMEELRKVIEDDGSFKIIQLEQHNLDNPDYKVLANSTRAAVEPIFSNQFGQSVMDELFRRFEEKMSRGGMNVLFLIVSLTRE